MPVIANKNGILVTTSRASVEKLHDYVAPYSYCGIALRGTTTSDSMWKVTKIEINENGTTTVTVAQNIAWDNRYSETYL